MDSTDIDTSRFESWPLLQPNEIHTLPTVVLRASMAELEKVLKQGSDDPGNGTALPVFLVDVGEQ